MSKKKPLTNAQKLDQILEALRGITQGSGAVVVAPGARPAYETPELFANQIARETMDGVTVQKDGSTWTIGVGTGRPEQFVYGYVNKAKDPAMWAAMAAIMGEERLIASVGPDPWVRIRANPRGVLTSHQPNAITVGKLFENLLPAYPQ